MSQLLHFLSNLHQHLPLTAGLTRSQKRLHLNTSNLVLRHVDRAGRQPSCVGLLPQWCQSSLEYRFPCLYVPALEKHKAGFLPHPLTLKFRMEQIHKCKKCNCSGEKKRDEFFFFNPNVKKAFLSGT